MHRAVAGGSARASQVRYAVAGAHHALALTGTGALYAWGCGRGGVLGLGATPSYLAGSDAYLPTLVPNPADPAETEAAAIDPNAIFAGHFHSAFLANAEGELHTWGRAAMPNTGPVWKGQSSFPAQGWPKPRAAWA